MSERGLAPRGRTAKRGWSPLIRRLIPNQVTTTELIGLAMLNAARHGAPKRILDPRDINSLA